MLFTLFDIAQMVGRGSGSDGRRRGGGVLGDGRLRVRLLRGAIPFVDQICKEFVAFFKNTESIKLSILRVVSILLAFLSVSER